MQASKFYRDQAEKSLHKAQRAGSIDEREAFLRIAEGWRELAASVAALEAARDPTRST